MYMLNVGKLIDKNGNVVNGELQKIECDDDYGNHTYRVFLIDGLWHKEVKRYLVCHEKVAVIEPAPQIPVDVKRWDVRDYL